MPRLKTGSAFSLALLIALTLVAAACGGDEEGASTTVGGQKANDHGSQDGTTNRSPVVTSCRLPGES